jgi:hypothetical protein
MGEILCIRLVGFQDGRLENNEIANQLILDQNDNENYQENRDFNANKFPWAFSRIQKDKLIEVLDLFMETNLYAEQFIDQVPEEVAPNYRNIIAVEMNLMAIKQKLWDNFYRSKEQLFRDLKLIDENCNEFNRDDEVIKKDSKAVYVNLKKKFEQVLTYKLRNIPQRKRTALKVEEKLSQSDSDDIKK